MGTKTKPLIKHENVMKLLNEEWTLDEFVKNTYYFDMLDSLKSWVFEKADLDEDESLEYDYVSTGSELYDLNHRLNVMLGLSSRLFNDRCAYFVACEIIQKYPNGIEWAYVPKKNGGTESESPLLKESKRMLQKKIRSNYFKHVKPQKDKDEAVKKLLSWFDKSSFVINREDIENLLNSKARLPELSPVQIFRTKLRELLRRKKINDAYVNDFCGINNSGRYHGENYLQPKTDFPTPSELGLPTKELLIKYMFLLRYKGIEYDEVMILADLAMKTVSTRKYSCMYKFSIESERDKLILSYLRDIEHLKDRAKLEGYVSIIYAMSDILRDNGCDPIEEEASSRKTKTKK